MFRENGQPLGSFPGQQGAQGVKLNVQVICVFMCPQRECNQQFPKGAHGGPVDNLRGES